MSDICTPYNALDQSESMWRYGVLIRMGGGWGGVRLEGRWGGREVGRSEAGRKMEWKGGGVE